MTPDISKQNRLLLAGSLLAAAILLFTALGSGGIPAAQEGRTAIIVKNMLDTGNWLDMQVQGGVPYEKPVGHYWMCLPFAAALHADRVDLSGCATEWAVRLPSAISAMLALVASMLLAFRIFGARTAALTVIVLSTSVTFLHLGRLAHIDMPLCASFTCAMFFLYIGYFEKMKFTPWLYGFYACLGWGMILKGPLVVILAGITVVAMMLRTRNWRMIWELRPLTGGAVFLLVSMPWYVIETIRSDGAFFEEFIMKQNISRFTGVGSTYRNGERMAIWYYIPKMTAGMLPWSIPALAAGIVFFKRLIRLRFSNGPLFLFMWFLTGFVFFSLSALKRGDYLLPIYPALGILTAAAVVRGCEKLPPLPRRHVYWLPAVLGVLLAGGLTLSFSGVLIRLARARLEGDIRHIGKSDANNMLLISSWINSHVFTAVIISLTILALAILLAVLLRQGRCYAVLFMFCVGSYAVFGFYVAYLDPVSGDRYRSVKSFTREARDFIPKEETVLIAGDFNTELLYFLDRPYSTEGDPGLRFAVTSRRYADNLLKTRPGQWEELLQTVENHQYPAVLLRRKEEVKQTKQESVP